MTNYPTGLDSDNTLPAVNNNITEVGAEAINSLRDAVFAIETALGINIAGSQPSLASRLLPLINTDGSPNTSTLFALGLVTLPITNNQIADNAGIPESKLMLDFRTADLFNYVRDLAKDVNLTLGWQSITGIKLEPHLLGFIYRHDLAQIDVAETSIQFLNNVFRVNRDNTDAYALINDMNNELLAHQWADGSPLTAVENIVTNDGGVYPSNYAHTAGGVFINTSRFVSIPQTVDDVQMFADYIDNTSVLTLGTRIQNLYSNGISRNSRSSSLTIDGYGQSLLPVTPAVAFLRGTLNLSLPLDDIAMGDDIVQFLPASDVGNVFDSQFALVRPGDIIRVAYAGDGYNVEVPYLVAEKKFIQGSPNIYIIRIAGKNIAYAPNATARIDRPLFNNDKQGVLAVAAVNSPTTTTPSLIIGTARGAQCLGVGFSPDQFNESHYLLYLTLYPDGNPLDAAVILPGIDVTGNQGTTPGLYTLSSIVAATNIAFRQPGYNYRFLAFQHDGEFGIMLADSYNNASFSVISAIVNSSGVYDQTNTQINYPNNVIDLFPSTGSMAPDPLGFGPFGAGVASPPYTASYGSVAQALFPTQLFTPLKRNNYYVNGVELERLSIDVDQVLDVFGDGYWIGTIDGYAPNNGPPGHMLVTYNIPLDLSASGLKPGKTIVVQSFDTNLGVVNYGRFIIQNVIFTCCPPVTTQIIVFDAVHAQGFSPTTVAPIGSQVALYFNSDSVSFNNENASDFNPINATFKRSFEVYIDGVSNTFTHERARFSLSGNVTVNGVVLFNSNLALAQFDMVGISPTLRGYQFGPVNKITLSIISFDPVAGILTGNLASYDGSVFTRPGPITSGKIGEVIRFYDETNIDYIDLMLDISSVVPVLANQILDIQLFPSLQLDQEIMILASCQVRTDSFSVDQIYDLRQFGNTSEQQLTDSAIDFIDSNSRVMHFNGVIRGFDLSGTETYGNGAGVLLTGGLALVNGNFNALNDQVFIIPPLFEVFNSLQFPLNYALCLNDDNELVTLVLTDFDNVLHTPNAPNRIVTVTNAFSSTSYQIDSCTFSYLLNHRPDLTPLYIVSATVTATGLSSSTAITVRDVRRFVNSSDANIPAILTADTTQGNFRTLASAVNWLNFNSGFQNVLEIKGVFGAQDSPAFNFPVTIVGAGNGAFLSFNNPLVLNNVTFKNLTILFNGTFNATNVKFDNCDVSVNGATSFSNTQFSDGIFAVNNTVSMLQSSITNSIVVVSVIQGFALSNGTIFDNCTVNYAANPIGFGSYSTSNLVNSSSGMIYVSLSGNLSNISITNCSFSNSLSDHFPFFSIQLTTSSAILQNVKISNNQFNSLSLTNDLRAVIAITSTVVTAGSVFPIFPTLVDVVINNNICNYDQMILLSTDRIPGTPITGSMLNTINCCISGNTCGTIGFINSEEQVTHQNDASTAINGFVRNKSGQLIIEKNSCKFITNLDSLGAYIAFYVASLPTVAGTTSWVQVGTGSASILNNSVNWIQVGSSAYNNAVHDGLIISGNRISPNDPSYLNNYTDVAQSGVTPANVGILLRGETVFASTFSGISNSIITGNTISQKPVFETTGGTFTFFYDAGIACFNNAIISNNNICGVVNSGSSSIIYLWTSGQIRVIGNMLFRNDAGNAYTIQGYVSGNLNAINQVSIVENTFDLTTVDISGINTQTGFNIPSNWEFRNNVNQTFYVEIPLVDSSALLSVGNAGGVNGNPAGNATPVTPQNTILNVASGNVQMQRILNLGSGGPLPNTQYTAIVDGQVSPVIPTAFGKTFALDYIIPPNSRLTNVAIGISLIVPSGVSPALLYSPLEGPSPPAGSTYNCVTLTLMKYSQANNNITPSSVLDVFSNVGFSTFNGTVTGDTTQEGNLFANIFIPNNVVGGSAAAEAAWRSGTQYAIIPLTSANYRTGQNYRIAISVDLSFAKVITTQVILCLSPVVVTCIYGA